MVKLMKLNGTESFISSMLSLMIKPLRCPFFISQEQHRENKRVQNVFSKEAIIFREQKKKKRLYFQIHADTCALLKSVTPRSGGLREDTKLPQTRRQTIMKT